MKIIALEDGLLYKVKDSLAKEVYEWVKEDALSNGDNISSKEIDRFERLFKRVETEGQFIGTVYTNLRI